MKNYALVQFAKIIAPFLLIICFSNCKKDCSVVNANYSPIYLDHAGMAPERVQFSGTAGADSYSWTVQGVSIEGNDNVVTFGVSGSYSSSLIAKKGNDQCSSSAPVEITPFPSAGSQRAISYFEASGDTVNLIAKVIDTQSEILNTAIPGLPPQGGGMDVDNDGKKIFACPFALLASCYPNKEDLQAPVPPMTISGSFYDLALDPDDDRVYFTVLDGSTFSIKSTDMYNNGSMDIQEVYTEMISSGFFYITNDRKDNVLYWVKKGDNIVKRVENGISSDFLTLNGGVFGDIEYDDTNNRFYFVGITATSSFIQSIKATDFSGEVVEVGPINGDIPFIYVDEDRQELFWAEDDQNTISSKKVGIQGTTIHVDNLGPVKGLTVGFYGD